MQWIHAVAFSHTLSLIVLGYVLLLFIKRYIEQRNLTAPELALVGVLVTFLGWIISNGISIILAYRGNPFDSFGAIGGIMAQGIAYFIYLFTESFPRLNLKPMKNKLRFLFITGGTFLVIPLVFLDGWVYDRRLLNGVVTAIYGPLFVITGGWATFTATAGLVLLAVKIRNSTSLSTQLHLKNFFTGLIIIVFLGFLLAYILPLAGFDNLLFLGSALGVIFISFVSYAVVRDRFFDLNTAGLRVLLKLLPAIIVPLLVYTILRLTIPEYSFQVSGPIFFIFFMALYSLAITDNYLRRHFLSDRFLFSKVRPDRLLDSMEKLLARWQPSGSVQMELLGEILHVLARSLHFSRGTIIILNDDGSPVISSLGKTPDKLDLNIQKRILTVMNRQNIQKSFRSNGWKILMIGDINDERQTFFRQEAIQKNYPRLSYAFTNFFDSLKDESYQLLIPVVLEETVLGFILLGEKKENLPYRPLDLHIIESVRVSLAILFRTMKFNLPSATERPTEYIELPPQPQAEVKRIQIGKDRTLVYRSQIMQDLIQNLRDTRHLDFPMLITGETGTGKELIALLAHQQSNRSYQPFVAVNCAAITPTLWESEFFGHVKGAFTDARSNRAGKIQEAGEGTLFLDEIGEIPLDMQAKLLRVLQEKIYYPVGSSESRVARCRIICATNRPLENAIAAGTFRDDLFHRINVLRMNIPALRNRRDDILPIITTTFERYKEEINPDVEGFEQEILDAFFTYSWPGNVRELENAVIRSMIAAGTGKIKFPDIPPEIRQYRPYEKGEGNGVKSIDQPEKIVLKGNYTELITTHSRNLVLQAMQEADGNKSKAAELLGISRPRLYKQLQDLNIDY